MAYNPTSATGAWGSLGNSIDDNPGTRAYCPTVPYSTWKAILFSGFPASPTPVPVIRLDVNIELYSIGFNKWALRYSLNSGSSWIQVGDAERHDEIINSPVDITLPESTDMSLVQVELSLYGPAGSPPTGFVYEVYIVPPDPPPGQTLLYAPYPDPSYPGVIGVSYRRFWIGRIFNAPWVYTPAGAPDDNEYTYINYNVPWQINFPWDIYDAAMMDINTDDPASSYVDVDISPWDGDFPTWVAGASIYQNDGVTWSTVLPWDVSERQYWIYPDPITTDTKIYYNNMLGSGFPAYYDDFEWYVETAGAGSVPYTIDGADPDIIYHNYFSDNMESVVTECGEDEQGYWIKVRPCTEGDGGSPGHVYDQVYVNAGMGMNVEYRSGGGGRYIEIAPWGRKTRTGCIYVTDGPNNRIIQRETPSLVYMSEYTDANISYPTGICNDGTSLYVLNNGNNKLLKYTLGDATTGTAEDLVYDTEVAVGTSPRAICTDGTSVYYLATENVFSLQGVVKRACADLAEEANIHNYAGSNNFDSPMSLTVDSTYLYVADRTTILKFDKAALAFVSRSYSDNTRRMAGIDNDGTYLYVAQFQYPVV